MDDLTFYLIAFVFISGTGVGAYYIYITFFKPKPIDVATTSKAPLPVVRLPEDEINKMGAGFVLLIVMFVLVVVGASGYMIRKRWSKKNFFMLPLVDQSITKVGRVTKLGQEVVPIAIGSLAHAIEKSGFVTGMRRLTLEEDDAIEELSKIKNPFKWRETLKKNTELKDQQKKDVELIAAIKRVGKTMEHLETKTEYNLDKIKEGMKNNTLEIVFLAREIGVNSDDLTLALYLDKFNQLPVSYDVARSELDVGFLQGSKEYKEITSGMGDELINGIVKTDEQGNKIKIEGVSIADAIKGFNNLVAENKNKRQEKRQEKKRIWDDIKYSFVKPL